MSECCEMESIRRPRGMRGVHDMIEYELEIEARILMVSEERIAIWHGMRKWLPRSPSHLNLGRSCQRDPQYADIAYHGDGV